MSGLAGCKKQERLWQLYHELTWFRAEPIATDNCLCRQSDDRERGECEPHTCLCVVLSGVVEVEEDCRSREVMFV